MPRTRLIAALVAVGLACAQLVAATLSGARQAPEAALAGLGGHGAVAASAAAEASVTVDFASRHPISPLTYGIFFEEVSAGHEAGFDRGPKPLHSPADSRASPSAPADWACWRRRPLRRAGSGPLLRRAGEGVWARAQARVYSAQHVCMRQARRQAEVPAGEARGHEAQLIGSCLHAHMCLPLPHALPRAGQGDRLHRHLVASAAHAHARAPGQPGGGAAAGPGAGCRQGGGRLRERHVGWPTCQAGVRRGQRTHHRLARAARWVCRDALQGQGPVMCSPTNYALCSKPTTRSRRPAASQAPPPPSPGSTP